MPSAVAAAQCIDCQVEDSMVHRYVMMFEFWIYIEGFGRFKKTRNQGA